MRDLYHGIDFAYRIKRVNNDLEEPDRTDFVRLVKHMQDRERAILWIMICITAFLLISKQLAKPKKLKRKRCSGDISPPSIFVTNVDYRLI